jgi:density-regulated protein DRP1
MGKKKGKSKEPKDEEPDDDEAEGEESTADLMAKMGFGGDEEGNTVDVSDAAPAPPPKKKETAADDEDGPTLRDSVVLKGRSETRHLKSVPYCEVSGLPFEYCEFSPLIAKCRESFEKNYTKYFPDVEETEEALAELMTKLGMIGEKDAASKKAQSAKKGGGGGGGEGGGGGGGGKKKKDEVAQVVIELNNRNKKKHITVVKGLEGFPSVDPAAAAKLFGKRFACGSALKKGQNGQSDCIEIQGSCRDELPGFMVDKLKLSLEDIVLLIDNKKIKAADHIPSK